MLAKLVRISEGLPRRPCGLALVVVFVVTCLLEMGAAQGQISGALTAAVKGAGDEPAAATPVPHPPAQRASIEKSLEALNQRLKAVKDAGPPPAGISQAEVDAARKAATMLKYVYQAQLDALDRIEEHSKAREAAEKQAQVWPGFRQSPPYSPLLLDDVREEVTTQRTAVEQLKAARRLIDVEVERFRNQASAAEAAARRAAEALDSAAQGSGERAVAAWRLELADAKARLAAEVLSAVNLTARDLEERVAAQEIGLLFSERKLAVLTGKVKITRTHIEEARRRLEDFRGHREAQLQSLFETSAIREADRGRALEDLKALRAQDKSPAQTRALQLAETRLRVAELWRRSLGQQMRIMEILVDIYHGMVVDTWERRYTILTDDDPEARQRARKLLAELVRYFDVWRQRAVLQLAEVRAALRDQERRVQATSDHELQALERDGVEALRQLESAVLSQESIVARRLARVSGWNEEFSEAIEARSVGDIASDLYTRVRDAVLGIWNYELLTIEDKVEVGGKTVITTRGVTVGKSIGAVLLFLLGLRLLTYVSRASERLMVRRFGVDEEQGRTLRRWSNTVGLCILLLITLNIAHIPLTVFAFAGGALAIGIGFGTQTLIKNLISGMILLVERNVRVGDIIEVEGITGRVTSVDIRSSTVRGFDGVESMIPNSMLLEEKVTNWTLTTADLRREIKVGVAYGSPVHQVAKILTECAERHGNVLKKPPPQVVFEDFGDNALVFALYFWVNYSPTGVGMLQIMSDLRFMIEKQLGEAGIVIAFPQRDVHLDTSQPLKIEVVPPGATPA